MNIENKKKIVESLKISFLKAGEASLHLRKQGLTEEIKSDGTPVTNGDLEVNKIITNKIKELTSEYPIVSEESSLNKSNKNLNSFWLVDPIDGTHDYINNKDEFTLNASLILNNIPVIGIIYAPAKNRLFFSYGKGLAFEINNGKKVLLNCKKINLNEIIGLENSGGTPSEILKIYKKYKVSQTLKMSSSLKFCILASGEADIYAAKARAFEWDIAAGHTILEHAGGSITTHDEKKFLYGKENYKNLGIIAKRSNVLEK